MMWKNSTRGGERGNKEIQQKEKIRGQINTITSNEVVGDSGMAQLSEEI
jgi:hypothetical protein